MKLKDLTYIFKFVSIHIAQRFYGGGTLKFVLNYKNINLNVFTCLAYMKEIPELNQTSIYFSLILENCICMGLNWSIFHMYIYSAILSRIIFIINQLMDSEMTISTFLFSLVKVITDSHSARPLLLISTE